MAGWRSQKEWPKGRHRPQIDQLSIECLRGHLASVVTKEGRGKQIRTLELKDGAWMLLDTSTPSGVHHAVDKEA